ncbi:hypothetical protein [Lentzea albidocapillata]|uniref:Thioesterase-like superfamily protein n=1 Tax=Lentzea albidocapillata TaxID=40571 RepID=A0A1W2CW73_9PSEU|nr:hypothetical protein [Lentzea albidocapillata]SMC89479.1 hypothetical protein SAMN05660733_02442 [Lentzea albidocapillata]
MSTVTVASRFNGPPGMGNGGYSAGLLAAHVDARTVSVRLRKPVPLDRELQVRDGQLLDGDVVIASAEPAALDLEVPAAPTLDEALKASAKVPWRDRHPFPTCFGCGPGREDGIAALLGPLDGRDEWAGVWRPTDLLPNDGAGVLPEIVWAALDCPSAQPVAPDGGPAFVLGTFVAQVERPVELGVDHVLLAWELGKDGRKAYSASAIIGPHGVCGRARAVWVSIG